MQRSLAGGADCDAGVCVCVCASACLRSFVRVGKMCESVRVVTIQNKLR